MSNATTDLPAFPIPGPLFAIGLTKREYVAAMAMQGALANPKAVNADDAALVAAVAVECADALLAELAKEERT